MTTLPRLTGPGSPASWLARCRDLDPATVLRLLAEVDDNALGFSLTLDRAYRLTDARTGVRLDLGDQHAVTALLGARVLVPGRGRWVNVDGWPPRDHVLTLFISSTLGRDFHERVRGGERS
ncbi:hypothetical protein GCM10022267_50080 [Lentzea roselyniae]|uniref:Uncharacterized protein n=1 Tax=Lentzea roselyniae TaxID=531940 RepID=A0ABP7BDZ6_9PSEU